MKDCKTCRGSGVHKTVGWGCHIDTKLCPCISEKMARYREALEQYRGTGIQLIQDGDPVTDDDGFPVYVDYATAALEET